MVLANPDLKQHFHYLAVRPASFTIHHDVGDH